MRFQITGANAETGDDVNIMLDAPSQSDVERIAHDKGILVSAIKPLTGSGAVSLDMPPHSPSHAGNGHGHGTAAAPAVHSRNDLSAISMIEDEPGAAPHVAGVITVNATAPSGQAQSAAGHIAEQKGGEAAMEYHIMLNQSLYLLESAVNKHLKEGWEPQGGVAVGVSNNAMQYFQSLIRKKKPAAAPPAPDAPHA